MPIQFPIFAIQFSAENKNKMNEIGEYKLLSPIGEGSFATVRLAEHKVTHLKVAVKIVPRAHFFDPEAQKRFQREVDFIKDLEHPFIAEFFELLEDAKNFYVVMEYVENGNMLEFVNRNGELPEDTIRRYFFQLVAVLEYLHDVKRIAHRDLKAENVLLDRHDNIRLIDFGLSNMFSAENPYLKTACGSPAYASPEMVRGQPYTKAGDVWSAGILLYAMACGELPFEDDNIQRLLQKIIYTKPQFPSSMSPQLKDLITRMLTKEPEKRITLAKIKEHPWFSQFEYMKIVICGYAEKWSVSKEHNIDRDIVKQMTDSGYDCSGLVSDLICGKVTQLTAVYRMLLKDKITDLMAEMSAGTKTVHIQEPEPRFPPVPPQLQMQDLRGGKSQTPTRVNPRVQIFVDGGDLGSARHLATTENPRATHPKPPPSLLETTTNLRKTFKPTAPMLQARKRAWSVSDPQNRPRPRPHSIGP